MSVYLKNNKVVLSGGSIATAEACCCPTGACCNGADCSIQTQLDCENSGGTYQGDDTSCDPNPCELPPCACAYTSPFFNPDDGLYYTTRIDDSCALMSTYSGLTDPSIGYQSFSISEESCDPRFTGSVTCFYDCDTSSCSGEIVCNDPGDCLDPANCYVGCDPSCDQQCGTGAPVGIRNTQILGEPCMPAFSPLP